MDYSGDLVTCSEERGASIKNSVKQDACDSEYMEGLVNRDPIRGAF